MMRCAISIGLVVSTALAGSIVGSNSCEYKFYFSKSIVGKNASLPDTGNPAENLPEKLLRIEHAFFETVKPRNLNVMIPSKKDPTTGTDDEKCKSVDSSDKDVQASKTPDHVGANPLEDTSTYWDMNNILKYIEKNWRITVERPYRNPVELRLNDKFSHWGTKDTTCKNGKEYMVSFLKWDLRGMLDYEYYKLQYMTIWIYEKDGAFRYAVEFTNFENQRLPQLSFPDQGTRLGFKQFPNMFDNISELFEKVDLAYNTWEKTHISRDELFGKENVELIKQHIGACFSWDAGKVNEKFTKLLENSEWFYYFLIDRNDILKRDGVVGNADKRTRKKYAIAIYLYTICYEGSLKLPGIYAMMNHYTRVEKHLSTCNDSRQFGIYDKYGKLLGDALKFLKNNVPREPIDLYRGINLDLTCYDCEKVTAKEKEDCLKCNGTGTKPFDIEQTIKAYYAENGFISTSSKKEKALFFAATKDNRPHRILMKFSNTKHGVAISRYSFYPKEEEVLFPAFETKHNLYDIKKKCEKVEIEKKKCTKDFLGITFKDNVGGWQSANRIGKNGSGLLSEMQSKADSILQKMKL